MAERNMSEDEKERIRIVTKNVLERWLNQEITDDFEIPRDTFSDLIAQVSIETGLDIYISDSTNVRTFKDFLACMETW